MEIHITRIDGAIRVNPAPPYLVKYLQYTKRGMEMVGWKKEIVYTKVTLHKICDDGSLVTFRGFFNKIVALITKNHDTYTVEDLRTPLPEIDREAVLAFNFREHQIPLMVELLDKLQQSDGIIWATGGAGKAQDVDCKVLTPNGWKRIGDIVVGDSVAGRQGEFNKVIGVYPQGVKKSYKVTMDDGGFTYCCDEHLWLTQTASERDHKKPAKVRRLSDIASTLVLGVTKRYTNHSIPFCKPIDFPNKEQQLHPYLMGALLGDGGIKYATMFTTADDWVLNRVREVLPSGDKLQLQKGSLIDYAVTKVTRLPVKQKSKTRQALEHYGLAGCGSADKFIPDDYKFASRSQRIELLRGLMDTDGSASQGKTAMEYCTVSEKLSRDVRDLVLGLGGRVSVSTKSGSYVKNGVKHVCRKAYRLCISFPETLDFNPFALPRKAALFKPTKRLTQRFITSIEYVKDVESVCIEVDSPEHLYITDDYIVTHNTVIMAAIYAAYNQLNTIIAVPLATVAKQTYKEFKKRFPNKDIGLMGAGGSSIGEHVTITTSASLKNCALEKCKLFMFDEAQASTTERIQELVTSMTPIRAIGVTATDENLFNKADKVLTALYGNRLCEFTYEDGEASGAVVPGVVYFLETPQLPRTYTNIDQSMKWALKMHEGRNRLIGQVAAAIPADWQCIAFVDHVDDHLVNVMKYMPAETKWMHRSSSKKKSGSFALSTKQQNQIMTDFADNKIRLLVATDCLRAGVSVDNVRCVIQCSGGTSEVEILQEAFRGSRIMTEEVQERLGVSPKTHFVLVDFNDEHDTVLANMSKARRKIYAEQGWTIKDVKSVEEIDFTWNGK